MKKIFFTLLLVAGALSITLIYSCKKKDDSTTNNNNPATNSYSVSNNNTFNDDANYYKSENDNLNNDINSDISTYHPGMRLPAGSDPEKFQSYNAPCGATVDTTQINQQKLIYHFNPAINCGGRHRSGTITVQLTNGTHWSDPGAVLTFSTTDYTVIRWDGKSISFNGTKTLKNVNGSSYAQWLAFFYGTGTIKLQERAVGVKVTFNGVLHATWNTAYTAEWSYTPSDSIVYFTANGDSSGAGVGGYNNVGAWGTNRFGQLFYTHYDSPIVCDSYCNTWEPLSGVATHNVDNSTLTLTLGTDTAGVHQNYTAKNCPWGFNVTWHFGNGSNGSANIPYL
jgi:hypothetical protein